MIYIYTVYIKKFPLKNIKIIEIYLRSKTEKSVIILQKGVIC